MPQLFSLMRQQSCSMLGRIVGHTMNVDLESQRPNATLEEHSTIWYSKDLGN